MNRKEPYNILTIGDNIKVIALTGGPCGLKTTGLSRLKQMLADRGYKVLISPESATKLILAGMMPGELGPAEFQEEILLDLLAQEERVLSIATRYRDKGHKVVVLCDRGAMDGEAYVEIDTYSEMLSRLGFTRKQLCDERYHAVIHMRTAAIGALEFYTLANNKARTETECQAQVLDERTLGAWTRHSHPRVIDNSTDAEGKLHRLFVEVCGILGDPVPLEQEDKFLIGPFNPSVIPVKWIESKIVQDYLVSPKTGEEHRVRARTDTEGGASYYYTVKRSISPGVRAEEERMITHREYEAFRRLRDPEKYTIKKRRICFFWREQFFEVDLFEEPISGLALMEVERTDRTPKLELPPFVTVRRNVTDEFEYTNIGIATNRNLRNR